MRSYGHYCGLARALDLVGDRWTLLIVRELLLRGPSRYTDLHHGLPGIATNLLVTRLREMEASGLVVREDVASPAPATLFRLTPRGEELEDVLAAFGRWAGPLMGECGSDDESRTHWLALPMRLYLSDHSPKSPPISIEVRSGGESLTIETGGGEKRVQVRPGESPDADAVLDGPPDLIMNVLMGRASLASARRKGLRFRGEPSAVERVSVRRANAE